MPQKPLLISHETVVRQQAFVSPSSHRTVQCTKFEILGLAFVF